MEVWKFALPILDEATVPMPAGARVIHLAVQHETPCIWALVDPFARLENRRFRVAGTGHPLTPDASREYLGSFLLYGGNLVFHVFALTTETRDTDYGAHIPVPASA